MATHSSILAWRTPWSEEPGGLYSPWGHKESDTTEATAHSFLHAVASHAGTGRGNHQRNKESMQAIGFFF